MPATTTYHDYVTDRDMLASYEQYQSRYVEQIRESDRVIVDRVRLELQRSAASARPRVLDIGCSTGNLLRHLMRAVPEAELHGADLATSVIDTCRGNPALAGIRFEVRNILEPLGKAEYDVIVANAVAVYFDDEQYRLALTQIAKALRPGGLYIAYEWLHGFRQELEIVEKSRSHPRGLRFHFRSYAAVREAAAAARLTDVEFAPFHIPIDLDRGATFGANADGFEDLNTFTRQTQDGERLMFRGALHQPWCHLYARRAESA